MHRSNNPPQFRVLPPDPIDQAAMRTSDFVLAAAGIGLLGGFCLLLIAGLSTEAEGLTGLSSLSGDS